MVLVLRRDAQNTAEAAKALEHSISTTEPDQRLLLAGIGIHPRSSVFTRLDVARRSRICGSQLFQDSLPGVVRPRGSRRAGYALLRGLSPRLTRQRKRSSL